MSDLTANQKGMVAYRIILSLSTIMGTALVSVTLGYVKQTMSDVSQIKWEIPILKQTAINDKAYLIEQIKSLESRLNVYEKTGSLHSEQIASLRTDIAILKSRLP